ncbi:MAG: class I SAM-dependent methyltransferase [Rhodobacteraceae bacterium]|nr:class I SAM-dependent methyltransferase [Paracoccaceae bacterium]
MSFSLEWLRLREPADHAARDAGLLAEVGERLAQRSAPLIVDLGCGAGSNSRALRSVTPADARWRLVDYDPALLGVAKAEAQAVGVSVEARTADLSQGFGDLLAGADLVSAAALFDLGSAEWIDSFVAAVPETAMVYAALSYDGQEQWSPPHPDDAAVLAAFKAHQRRDKGFGPSLGPEAGDYLVDRLRAAGRDVRTASSPWRLGRPESGALMDELASGIARVAEELDVDATAWRNAPRASCEIGHIDVLATRKT